MRYRAMLFVALFGAVSLGAAFGQQAAATKSTEAPSWLSFQFDAPHGQMTASGFTLDLKPKVVGLPTLKGTVEITLTINIESKFGHDTVFPCAATVIGGQIDPTNFVLEGGVETANGIATVNKSGVGTCTLTIPYEWTVASDPAAVNGLIVAYAAGAVSHEGVTRRTTLQVQGVDSLPANGATTKLAFSVAL